ncbi:MAG: metallophosphoesterase [Halanaerobiales bacterium]|nr:metallophosphoesterase [Halanaerobiales bacterium]
MLYLIIILVIIYLSYKLIDIHTHDVEINRQSVYNDYIKNEIKILHLTDLHFDFNKKYQTKILNLINNIEYDILLFGGDYINHKQYMINLNEFLRKIENKKHAFAVFGNHDYQYNLKKINKIFSQNNIKILNNEYAQLVIKKNEVNLIGIGSPDIDKDDYNKTVKNLDLTNSINILLSHCYYIIEKENLNQINLVLVGDTHGYQINLPIIRNILKTKFDLKYTAGKYILNHLILIVNRGLGTIKLPFRINSKPELLLLSLENK